MSDYKVRDPKTGRTVTIRGDGPPPTESELETIFATAPMPAHEPAKAPAPKDEGAAAFLPMAGGMVGGIAGGIPGAAMGGAAGQGYRSLLNSATELPGAVADIARNVAGGHGKATAQGFAEGSGIGAADAAIQGAIQGVMTGAGKLAMKAPGLVASGLRMVGVPVPYLPQGVSSALSLLRGARAAPAATQAAERAIPAAAPAAEAALPKLAASRVGHTAASMEVRPPLTEPVPQFGPHATTTRAPVAAAKPPADYTRLSSWEREALDAENAARGGTPKINAADAARYLKDYGSMIPPGTRGERQVSHLYDAQMSARLKHLLEDPKASLFLSLMGGGAAAGAGGRE